MEADGSVHGLPVHARVFGMPDAGRSAPDEAEHGASSRQSPVASTPIRAQELWCQPPPGHSFRPGDNHADTGGLGKGIQSGSAVYERWSVLDSQRPATSRRSVNDSARNDENFSPSASIQGRESELDEAG